MPLTVLQQFIIAGWWVLVAALMVCAWVCYLKLRKRMKKRLWILDLLLVVVLFSYILGLKVYL